MKDWIQSFFKILMKTSLRKYPKCKLLSAPINIAMGEDFISVKTAKQFRNPSQSKSDFNQNESPDINNRRRRKNRTRIYMAVVVKKREQIKWFVNSDLLNTIKFSSNAYKILIIMHII